MRAIVDFRISDKSVKTLKNLGTEVVKTPKLSAVYNAICGHADIMLCKLSENTVICEPTVADYFKIHGCSVISGETMLKSKYPSDIAYNAARVGNYLICAEKHTDKVILNYCAKNGIEIINTKQGYAKCSVCVVAENAIITSDKNIAGCALKRGIDVFVTDDRDIALTDFEHGFIGGASGLLNNSTLVYNGNIKMHRDCTGIEKFCEKYGVRIISLNDGRAEDIGSIICL